MRAFLGLSADDTSREIQSEQEESKCYDEFVVIQFDAFEEVEARMK